MIRRISLLWFLTLLAIAPAAIGQATSVPDAPFFTRTINLAPGEQQTIEEAFSANSSCDAIGTRYVLVVKNGNPDGTGMVQSGAAAINMLDYVGDWLADGADVITMDVPLLSANVALLQGQAPPDSAAVLTMELWRKPVTGTPFHQAYSFPQSTVNKKYTASFPVADPSIPAMLVVTRIGGMQTADQFFIKLNGTNFFSRTNFQYPVETLVAFVNLLPTNSVVIDAVAASQSSEVTVRVVQHGADTTPPAINLTGTIPAKVGTNSFTFTGTVTDAYRVGSLKLNGTKVNFTSSSGAFTTTVPLTHGIPNEFTFLAYDCAGHGTQVVKVIEWDRDSPVVTVTSPAANAFVKGPITVTGTVTDDTLGSPTVKVNGITATVTGNNWSANITLPAPDGAKTITVVATDLFQRSSSATVPVTLDTTAPTITSSLLPPATGGWSRAGATLSFTCADAGSGIAECTEPVTFDTSDLFLTEGKATDRAGNEAVIGVGVRVDADAPVVAINAPAAVVNTSSLNLQGTVSDVGSGIASVRCNGVAATVSGGSYTCSVPIAPGNNELRVVATDVAGNESAAMAQTKLDQRAPSISISTPENSTTVNSATITIAGFVSDDEQVAAFRIGSNAVQFDEAGSFSYETPLVSGNNTFTLTATDGGGNTATQTLQVHRYVVPVVSITSPADFANVRDATITVTGTVSDPGATVAVNDLAASVGSGGNFTVAGIPLQQGRTVITAIASSPGGGSATTSINIYRDSIPPRLAVYSPEDGATVYASPISVSGMVDDIVVGTINANQMRVTVNGVQAEVSNRAWLMRDVVLAPGQNTLLITATDEGGNSSVLSYHVTLQVPQLPHLELVSGNGQSGTIGNVLPAPLVVRGVSPAGQPVPDVPLTFTILDNDGLLAGGGTEARSVTVATNAAGLASVQWKLGNRAGAGNNRLEIRGQGFAAPIEATAAGHTGAAHLVVVDTGNNQFGVAGDALPRPLVAVVVDAGSNRLANVPVTFAVTKGAGSFSGQPTVTIQTDSDGRAIVRPTLDALAGEDNNIFTATAPGAVSSAAFMASGRTAGPAASTRISGVILDNTTIPIAGVSVRVEGTMMVTQTNAQGQFSLDGAPVGYVKLLIDGSTAQRAGTWPTLEYALYTLPGVDNDVGMPIYLLPIDVSRGVFTDDTTGGTLTLPELPGFKLEIAPGSATFPGGGRTGTVSATLVHADRMPMVPGFGQQPKFLLTIQPAGTHFDPPARLTFPNVDGLKPGEVTEMYSFDHDLGQFVAIGTGTVSDDGSVVTSDPGVGIIKGGWHCGGNPLPPSTWSNCTECEVCTLFGGCEPRSPLTPACSPDNSPCTWDVCRGRECAHIRPRVTIVSVTSPDNFRISAEPRMPRIVARAKVEVPGAPIPDTTPTAEFEWTVTMRWEAPKDVVEHTYGPYRGGAEWSPPPFTDIYGGTMIVKARLIRNGFGCMIAESRPVEVTATNPPVAQIVNRLHAQDSDFNELERDVLDGVICVESQNTMRQFTEAGYPRMNVTSDQRGAGLMQLTPPEDPRAYWDWRLNVDGGLDVFREKRDAATEYFSRHPEVPPTDTEMLRETIGLYNGGHQYDFENGRWDERDFSDPDRDAYVDAVIKRRCF